MQLPFVSIIDFSFTHFFTWKAQQKRTQTTSNNARLFAGIAGILNVEYRLLLQIFKRGVMFLSAWDSCLKYSDNSNMQSTCKSNWSVWLSWAVGIDLQEHKIFVTRAMKCHVNRTYFAFLGDVRSITSTVEQRKSQKRTGRLWFLKNICDLPCK